MMNIAFGLCLIMITLYFQFGKATIVIEEVPVKFVLDNGYITETHLWVRIVEGIIGIGLITLGIERLINRKKKESHD